MAFNKINTVRYHYLYTEIPNAQTIVFINSLGSDLRIWDKVFSRLKQSFSILRFDKPGHGLSSPLKTAYSIQDYADDLKLLLDHLSVKKIILIGISIGGQIALRFALKHPLYLEKNIISNTALKIGTNELWTDRIEKLKNEGLKENANVLIERWFSQEYFKANKVELDFYYEMISSCELESYLIACKALKEEDLTNDIAKLSVETLCIASGRDVSTPTSSLKEIVSKNLNAKYEEILLAGHLSCIEEDLEYADMILKFINN